MIIMKRGTGTRIKWSIKKFSRMEARIYNFEGWISLTDPDKLRKLMESELRKSGFLIVNFIEHFFDGEGYTCVWLLAESHLAVHTFPEHNKSYIQLSSCSSEKLNNLKASLRV